MARDRACCGTSQGEKIFALSICNFVCNMYPGVSLPHPGLKIQPHHGVLWPCQLTVRLNRVLHRVGNMETLQEPSFETAQIGFAATFFVANVACNMALMVLSQDRTGPEMVAGVP